MNINEYVKSLKYEWKHNKYKGFIFALEFPVRVFYRGKFEEIFNIIYFLGLAFLFNSSVGNIIALIWFFIILIPYIYMGVIWIANTMESK